ncbi:MAG: DUF3592 domain-containing protein [Cyanobacteria bacterium]|nr:DUF3592 domain-containing protein [Cyanobacteriota bacterium]
MLGRIFAKLLGFCGVIASIYLAFAGWMEVQEAQASQHWPSITARMIESSYTQEERCSKHERCHFVYKPHFVYQFFVHNTRYQNSKIDFGDPPEYQDEALVVRHIDEHPIDSLLKVYYDPKDPHKAVMVPGKTFGSPWWLLPFVVFMCSLAAMFGKPKR